MDPEGEENTGVSWPSSSQASIPISPAHATPREQSVSGRRDGLLFPSHTETDANGSLVEVRHLAPSTFYGKVTCATCKRPPDRCARDQKSTWRSDSNKAAAKHAFLPRETGWYAARTAAGHPTLHFHDLCATGATLLAQQGVTDAEIQAFLGDSTPQAAQRYVRAAQSRMKSHAERMSELAVSGNW